MERTTVILIGIVAAGLAAYGLSSLWNRSLPGGPAANTTSATPAPDFALKDYAGNTVTLSQFRGRPAVVNAWASWCPFCWKELLDFARVQEEFGNQFTTIGINRAEPLAVAKQFSDQVGLTGRLVLLLDPGDSFYQAIGGFSMPETIFVDKDGFIRIHKRGPMPVEEIREKVKSILD